MITDVLNPVTLRTNGLKIAAYKVLDPMTNTYSSLQWHFTHGDYLKAVMSDAQIRNVIRIIDENPSMSDGSIDGYTGLRLSIFTTKPDKDGKQVKMVHILDSGSVIGYLGFESLKLLMTIVKQTDSEGVIIQ